MCSLITHHFILIADTRLYIVENIPFMQHSNSLKDPAGERITILSTEQLKNKNFIKETYLEICTINHCVGASTSCHVPPEPNQIIKPWLLLKCYS